MKLEFSKEDVQFQTEVRDWLDEAWPSELREKQGRSALGRLSKADLVGWQKRLASKGWATNSWLLIWRCWIYSTQNYIFDIERARVGAPGVVPFGITMVARHYEVRVR